MADLRALANYAAGLYRRRLLEGESRLITPDERIHVDRARDEKKYVAEIRQAVLDGNVMRAMDLLR